MKKETIEYDVHLFVCTNHKEGRDNCANVGGADVCDSLKKWAKENHPTKVKVTRSGCLGRCSEGVAMVMHPDQKWITEVKSEDIELIKEEIKNKLNN